MRLFLLLWVAVMVCTPAYALDIIKVSDSVYALVGEKKQRSAANLGNNATFGVILTTDGVILVDPGGSWKGAEVIDHTIKVITDQPVTTVINTGGQDHRWLGNGYWKAKGARIIASQAAVGDHHERGSEQLSALRHFLGGLLEGTEPVYADTTFESEYSLTQGKTTLNLFHFGQAHTPGDSIVWLPEEKILLSGDTIYVERMLGVGPMSNAKSWISVFDEISKLNPDIIIPGHGKPTTLAQAKAQTYDYLVSLRQKVRTHMDDGKDLMNLNEIDQSAFSFLEQFDALSGRNAQQVYSEMEWED